MNKNVVLNWDYTPPTMPGLYLCCYGDVETTQNIRMVRFAAYGDGHLVTEDGIKPTDFNSRYKWAKLLVGSEAKRFVEGE
jgi:hypothetical protein